MTFHTYADQEMLFIRLADHLASELGDALDRKERALFVVPGGTTPGPVFDTLSGVAIDWSRVDVVLSDERWVPEVHIRSNTKLIRERLLVDKAAAANMIPLYARADNPEDVLDDLSARLEENLPIDVLLLGMGDDMHTASMFPGGKGTEIALGSDAPTLVPVRSDAVKDTRVTMSARVLNGAFAKHLLITGAKKKAAYERALSLPADQAPIASVLRNIDVHWAE